MADYIGGYRNVRKGGLPEEVTQSMAPVENVLNLRKTVLTKTAYPNAVDISFSELVTPSPALEETISVEEFFTLYNSIFYNIPAEGNVNSHQFLIEKSREYIGFPESTDEEIQVLLDEITSLRQNLLDTEQELLELQTNTDQNNTTISSNLTSDNIALNVGGGGNSGGTY
tara:strand:- start:2160 stop:2669 length:510 start_codon:yes stop_codon:yes gene_type:complete